MAGKSHSPGNWWLKDAHGLWITATQGGPPAQGIENFVRPAPDRFVAANGQYGYWCACLSGVSTFTRKL